MIGAAPSARWFLGLNEWFRARSRGSGPTEMSCKQGQKIVHRAQRAWGVGVVLEVGDDGRRLAVRFAGRDGVTVVSGRDPALLAVPDETPIDAGRRPARRPRRRRARPGLRLGAPLPRPPARGPAPRRRPRRAPLLPRPRPPAPGRRRRPHPRRSHPALRARRRGRPRQDRRGRPGLRRHAPARARRAGAGGGPRAPRLPVAGRALPQVQRALHAARPRSHRRAGRAGGGARAVEALPSSPRSSSPRTRRSRRPPRRSLRPGHRRRGPPPGRRRPLRGGRPDRPRAPSALLLLTATPVRLDPREYFRLLSLVETVPTTTLEAFLARLEPHEAYAAVARDLLGGGKVEDALARLRKLSPDDDHLRGRGREEEGAVARRPARAPGQPLRTLLPPDPQPARQGRRLHPRACCGGRTSPGAARSRRPAALCGRLARSGREGAGLRRRSRSAPRAAGPHRRHREARGAALRRCAEPGGARPAGGPLPRPRGAHAAPLRRVGRRGAQLPVRLAPGLPRPARFPAHARAAHRPARPAGAGAAGGDPRAARAGGGGLPGRPLREGDRHLRGAGGRPRRGAGLGARGARRAARTAHREGAPGLPARHRRPGSPRVAGPSTRGTTRCSTCAPRPFRS